MSVEVYSPITRLAAQRPFNHKISHLPGRPGQVRGTSGLPPTPDIPCADVRIRSDYGRLTL